MAKKPDLSKWTNAVTMQDELDDDWSEIQKLEEVLQRKKEALIVKALHHKKENVHSQYFSVVDKQILDTQKAQALLKERGLGDCKRPQMRFNSKLAIAALGMDAPMKVSQYLQKKKQEELY